MSWLSWLPWFEKEANSHLKQKLKTFEPHHQPLSVDDRKVLEQIRLETDRLNRNNVSRTMAYLHLYQRLPEMEWALLAHMVSRNAGWNMTDLKGEWISQLITPQTAQDYFRFMERANWLIFQDAYPQLLLYEYSKKKDRKLFHLLPFFHVSSFMQVLWNEYWEDRDKVQLTISLIINEQHYIEQRVIHRDSYSAPVIQDIKFQIEDWLDLNMILFPCLQGDDQLVLYGKQVDSFPDLLKRIELGKALYSLLFSPSILPGIAHWCTHHPHTGSRSDYWPHFFSPSSSAKKQTGESYVFSPCLIKVWPDQKHKRATEGDWFHDPQVTDLLHPSKPHLSNVQQEYMVLIEKLKLLVQAKQMIGVGE